MTATCFTAISPPSLACTDGREADKKIGTGRPRGTHRSLFHRPGPNGILSGGNTVDYLVTGGLVAILAIVLAGPFLVRRIEENLEAFLFACGVAALTV
ncbi:MAG TPA: DUF1646 family protein, partial [Methanomicrobiales archaeon]|nr:DUF1646 family protein [Methanomicrobiales archaeon]